MWAISLESSEFLKLLAVAAITSFGFVVLSRLLPAFDRMMDQPDTIRVGYDLCVAVFLVFTLSFFFAGLGFV